MMDFIAEYEKGFKKMINPEIFTRSYDRPLYEYILDICKNLEVIPAIKLLSWELITDQTKVQRMLRINKDLSKDPKVRNNRTLERLSQTNSTLCDLLILHYKVSARGKTEYVTRRCKIFKTVKGNRIIRNGKKAMLLNQIVDNSTYVKKNVIHFKTALHPLKLTTVKSRIRFADGETMVAPKFKIDLFYKVTNPLLYYLAKYTIDEIFEMFRLESFMSIVTEVIDPDTYLYVKLTDKLYLEVHSKAFYANDFIPKFVSTLADAFVDKEEDLTIKKIYNLDYWKGRLAEVFSKKRNPDKGRRVLISFAKAIDPTTQKRPNLPARHKRNTWTIVRWIMVNYMELMQKDSNDLKYKRLRANEVLAYYFDTYVTRNVYSLLNTDNPPFSKYITLLNSINENTLIRSIQSTKSASSPGSMFRYEQFNDFDAIDLTRYTMKGPTGLNGGKEKLSLRYRDFYPSHYGRLDLNVCSSSDPGLTGYLTANVQLGKNGYFDTESNEPDVYDAEIEQVVDQYGSEEYLKNRAERLHIELTRSSEGFITLH